MSDVNDRDEQFDQLMSEIANALQTAGLLADLQRRHAGELTRDAMILESAIERATFALRRLRPHLMNRRRQEEVPMPTLVAPELQN
jgi:tRNA U55 pseudouridine synthase TruB